MSANPCPQCSANRSDLESTCPDCGWTPVRPTECPQGQTESRTATIWWGYIIAPAVAPVLFSVVVFLLGSVTLAMNPHDNGTPIGVILIPLLSLTIGVVAAYFVAGVVGMPIIFRLEKQRSLNGLTIHGTALTCMVVLASLFCALGCIAGTPTGEIISGGMTFLVVATPFVLASSTTFWWILTRQQHGWSLRTMLCAVGVISILLGLCAPILRSLF